MKVVVRKNSPQYYFNEKNRKYEFIDLYLDLFEGLNAGSIKYWISFRNTDEEFGTTWHFKMTVGPYFNYHKQKLSSGIAIQIPYLRAL